MDKREWELVISKVQALKHTTDTAETIYEEANLELINTLLQLAREALPYYIDELIKARVELAAQGKLWESVIKKSMPWRYGLPTTSAVPCRIRVAAVVRR
jgi:hypothetical protein